MSKGIFQMYDFIYAQVITGRSKDITCIGVKLWIKFVSHRGLINVKQYFSSVQMYLSSVVISQVREMNVGSNDRVLSSDATLTSLGYYGQVFLCAYRLVYQLNSC